MSNYRHGDTGTRLHNIWRGILKRCDAKDGDIGAKYGGRGIGVCKEWRTYEAFRDWARANGYASDLSIERRDNDGDYEPGNCAWIPMPKQARNRRNTRRVTALGSTLSLAEWQERTGIGWSTIAYRIDAGWSPERAVTERPLPKPGRPRKAA